MPPLQKNTTLQQRLHTTNNLDGQNSKDQIKKNGYFEQDLVWPNVIVYITLHYFFILALWRLFTGQMMFATFLFNLIYLIICIVGVTGGNHRLWSHRTYKAKLPLRIYLMLLQSAAIQNNIYIWARDHRLHHKYTDTEADPHNSNRGFFFSHVGWLLMRKHPEVKNKGQTIDMSDVLADPVVQFQMKYYLRLAFLLAYILPAICTMYFFGDTLSNSLLAAVIRHVISYNGTWSVNSAAHLWGWRPYDSSINPVENPSVSFITLGEGWHNYHHTFPWDYKAAELGNYRLNGTTGFLDLMAYLGQAYDLKTVSPDMVRKRIARTGDGSHAYGKLPLENGNTQDHHELNENVVWGWDDKDMKVEDINDVTIKYKSR
ncbi:acyl-CoA Delta-9 desaturase-like [Diabrotica undecimpunctata]|uniref:acyl-CoA Delta-9 desaturase-like n=1 Tax=Diabrotica undecimpunctata TaxID=50387 RepID=UPI003B63411B